MSTTRCDEILRIIDEVLGVDPQNPVVGQVASTAIQPHWEELGETEMFEAVQPNADVVPAFN